MWFFVYFSILKHGLLLEFAYNTWMWSMNECYQRNGDRQAQISKFDQQATTYLPLINLTTNLICWMCQFRLMVSVDLLLLCQM